ncbi:PPOX class F420-dependent oxidoreductase [Cellulomonas sp.]|uniref:PPOX class F420-dependent oxidoreductase n=1 Tax=Cellulomonas sp. TaxID=40001 RepID=UPI002811620B|nr:PPOX class F420-dependent oxidoreductase [Cellulomonas sp.]
MTTSDSPAPQDPAPPARALQRLRALGDERYVSLTTFRRSGEPVATAVWLARDGDDLVVTTSAGSGKVKRLRHDPRVELRPCDRFGRVADDAQRVAATAEIVGADVDEPHRMGLLRDKYGLEYRAVTALERLTRRGGDRIVLRISAA